MIILPSLSEARGKFLMPQTRRQWMPASQRNSISKWDRGVERTWSVSLRRRDARRIVWTGVFEDRDDCDAFLWAMAEGSLGQQPALWRLPTPAWHPGLGGGEELEPLIAASIFITSGTSQTSPADWNNGVNTVQGIGAGASGSAVGGLASGICGGGGGGEYRKIANFSVATPGTTAFNYVIGTGGTARTANGSLLNGNAGTNTTFNTGSLIAVGGGAPSAGTGGAGGTGGTGAVAHNNGGTGGTITVATTNAAAGGGGAGGPTGVGSPGVSLTANGSSAGGNSDTATGSAGSSTTASAGGNGTDFDGTHGAGAGGGGANRGSGIAGGGAGGNYGGGGGGANSTDASSNGVSGAGIQGVIVITYTPLSAGSNYPIAAPFLP